jgi:putative transposase
MRTYIFKLYKAKRNKKFHKVINIAGIIYNHCIALHKRYYRLSKKSLNIYKLQKHLTKLKKIDKFRYFKEVGSQAIQDITQRIDRAYKLFFRNLKHQIRTAPPSFKKIRKYKSFTLKQSGWKLLKDNIIEINKQKYKYFKSRDIEGNIKTITIKRDTLGDIYLYFVCETNENKVLARTGKSVGYDFGLKQFLTASDNKDIKAPLFFKQNANDIKKANRILSRRKKGSNHCRLAKIALARLHKKIANQRKDFQFKLANDICKKYALICIEDLNIKGMQKRWVEKYLISIVCI